MRVEYSTVIDAPIDKVWKVIRAYASNWDPESPVKFGLSKGASDDQLACERTITLPNSWGQIVEKLDCLDDRSYRLVYSIVSSPFPCTGYVAEYQAFPITSSNKTFVRWFSNFEPNQETGGFNFQEVFTGVYSGGLAGAAKVLAAQK